MPKLRARQATALTHVGKLARAADVLEQGVAAGGEGAASLQPQLQSVQRLQARPEQK